MKVVRLPAAAVFLLLTACSSDNSRRGGDTGMAEGAPGGISSRDTMASAMADTGAVGGNADATPAGVLSQMNVANTTEIQLSNLAAKKASSPQVKEIARKLVAHHTRNREAVRALAQKVNVTLTPARGGSISSADSVALPQNLQGLSGAAFDKAWLQYQIEAHNSNIQRIQNQTLPAMHDPQIKSYLQKTLTDMQGHLASLEQVEQEIQS
jgi:putative membrane protein